jgi:hypothetical protein
MNKAKLYLQEWQVPQYFNIVWIYSQCISIAFDGLPILSVRTVKKAINMPANMTFKVILH